MSYNVMFTKENLDNYLKALAKVFRKLNGKTMPAEIILIGGASVLINYGFREMTTDIDAIIRASSVMKEAINVVGDAHELPTGWLNADFVKSDSYSDKLIQISTYYRTYSNVLEIRTVAAEYLMAMKLVAGRQYKYDRSDIIGIFWEHQKAGTPISYEAIDRAVIELYGNWDGVSDDVKSILEKVLESDDCESLYLQAREDEIRAKEDLVEFQTKYPEAMKEKIDINNLLDTLRHKRTENKVTEKDDTPPKSFIKTQ